MKLTVKTSLLVILLLLAIAPAFSFQTNLTYQNGTAVDQLYYDRAGTTINGSTYGSNSYMDHSRTNPNMYVDICDPSLLTGQQLDLVYSSINNSLLFSALHYRPQIHSLELRTINGTNTTCSTVDVSLAAAKTLFPGYLTPLLIPIGSNYTWSDYNTSDVYELDQLPQFLNGSYDIGIDVQGPPKTYYVTPTKAYDEQGQEITTNDQQLLVSFVNSSNVSVTEGRLAIGESMEHTQEIKGGETVYVNDILSLEIRTYEPCNPINESGYFIMNASVYEQNETCIEINGTSNLVINFADEIITGDGNETNGSKAPDVCAVNIKNSQDITLENLKTANYYYGICIENSTVTVFGTGTTSNLRGAKIDDNSSVVLVDLLFTNEEAEVVSQNNSRVEFHSVNVTTAFLDSTFKNAIVKGVTELPEPFIYPEMVDTGHFVEFIQNGNDSYAQMSFHYTDPLPNNGAIDNVSIYKYTRGTPYNITTTMYNATSNTTYTITTQNITPGNWTEIFTLVSPSEQLILSPNMTTFSIYAPYTELSQLDPDPVPDPDPDPEPEPDPVPNSGGQTGNGGTPMAPEFQDSGDIVAQPMVLNLTIPNNISLMQGEAGQINYTITNEGQGDSGTIIIAPQARRGWDSSNQTVNSLAPGDSFDGSVLLAPYEKELPGTYLVPVTVYIYDQNNTLVKLLSEVIQVEVTPRASLKRLKVVEYPPEIVYRSYSEIDVSFLVENIGDFDLENIDSILEDSDCVRRVVGETPSLKKGEEAELDYLFVFAGGDSCYTHMKFYSDDELVGFLPLHFVGDQKTPSLEFPQARAYKLIIWAVIFIAWSLLTAYVFERRARRK